MSNFSALVKQKRRSFGMSQKDFAALLGLNENGERTVRGWENGEHLPSAARRLAIESLKTDIPFKQEKMDGTLKTIDLFAGIGGIRLARILEHRVCFRPNGISIPVKPMLPILENFRTVILQRYQLRKFQIMIFFLLGFHAKHFRKWGFVKGLGTHVVLYSSISKGYSLRKDQGCSFLKT